MSVVLDSNVLLIAIGRRSRFRPIWNSFINGEYKLIVSEEILHEYEEILNEHSAPGAAGWVLEILIESPEVIYQRIYYSWNAISNDPDDNKFFDVAVAGGARYLVTNDAHFNEAKNLRFPHITIITAEQFLAIVVAGGPF
jgi:putative PIN family toxin of toxin-antitoxin system